MYKLQGLLSDKNVNDAWTAFGTIVARALRCGRAVKVPNFGIFTYTFPDY